MKLKNEELNFKIEITNALRNQSRLQVFRLLL